jgi:predicted membrane channel-forming protein YqfA (hemolysin III family)
LGLSIFGEAVKSCQRQPGSFNKKKLGLSLFLLIGVMGVMGVMGVIGVIGTMGVDLMRFVSVVALLMKRHWLVRVPRPLLTLHLPWTPHTHMSSDVD